MVLLSLTQYTDGTTKELDSSNEELNVLAIKPKLDKAGTPKVKTTAKKNKNKKKESQRHSKSDTVTCTSKSKQQECQSSDDCLGASPVPIKPISVSSRGSAGTLITSTTISTSASAWSPKEKGMKSPKKTKKTSPDTKAKKCKKSKTWKEMLISAPPFSTSTAVPDPSSSTFSSTPTPMTTHIGPQSPTPVPIPVPSSSHRRSKVAPHKSKKTTVPAFLPPLSSSTHPIRPTLSPSISTGTRVKAARQFLDDSLHESPPDQESSRVQSRFSETSVTSVQREKRKQNSRKKLANVSLECKSKHEAKKKTTNRHSDSPVAPRKHSMKGRHAQDGQQSTTDVSPKGKTSHFSMKIAGTAGLHGPLTESDDDINSFAESSQSVDWNDDSHHSTTALSNVPSLTPRPALLKEQTKKDITALDSSTSLEKAPETSKLIHSASRSRGSNALLRSPIKANLSRAPSRGLSHSRHRQTDLQGFLKHLAVLHDLKSMTDLCSAGDSAESTLSKALAKKGSPTRLERFQRLFQLKCVLLNLLQEASTEEANCRRHVVLHYYDVDAFDLDFVLEHIKLCEEESIEIRWDLVRTIFFPEEGMALCKHCNMGYRNGHPTTPMLDVHPTSIATGFHYPNWKSATNLQVVASSHSPLDSLLDKRLDIDNEDDDQSFWSPREEFQEDILGLFESAEAVMADLSFEERQERRLILVQLLQATSDEEAYLTTLSLDDMAEIVRHIRICKEIDNEVQWDMIRDIVFPLGVGVESPPTNVHFHDSWQSGLQEIRLGNSNHFDESFGSLEQPNVGLLNKFCHLERTNDYLRDLFDLAEEELGVILQHIHECKENHGSIRWDWIGDVLFPDDPDRHFIISDRIA